MSAQAPNQTNEQIISSIVINGDLSKLTPQQKVEYYREFCDRLGLDPLSQPFKLLRLNGREVLYCDRTGAQQLNKIHKVSHTITARETVSGCYVVTAHASTPEGRHTESIGAVPIDNLRGDSLCNAMMKAETKAKRRSTLDLLGLGILDETETDSIPNAQPIEAPTVPAAKVSETKGNPATVSDYKRKYNTVKEIQDLLSNATDVKDIASLYYVNAELVESTPDLKAAFTGKKNSFYNNLNNPNAVSVANDDGRNAPGMKGKPLTVNNESKVTIDPKIFKKKYDDASDLEMVLGNAAELREVAALYKENTDLIESSKDLKALFEKAKASFSGKK